MNRTGRLLAIVLELQASERRAEDLAASFGDLNTRPGLRVAEGYVLPLLRFSRLQNKR